MRCESAQDSRFFPLQLWAIGNGQRDLRLKWGTVFRCQVMRDVMWQKTPTSKLESKAKQKGKRGKNEAREDKAVLNDPRPHLSCTHPRLPGIKCYLCNKPRTLHVVPDPFRDHIFLPFCYCESN